MLLRTTVAFCLFGGERTSRSDEQSKKRMVKATHKWVKSPVKRDMT
jgi:hypothetical protein